MKIIYMILAIICMISALVMLVLVKDGDAEGNFLKFIIILILFVSVLSNANAWIDSINISTKDVEIDRLKEQIKSMKCCQNCEKDCNIKFDCWADNYAYWKLKEKE